MAKERNPLAKGLRVLEQLAITQHVNPQSIRELAATTGISPSTVHALLHMLSIEGYVAANDAKQYHLSDKFTLLAHTVTHRHPLWELARPYVEALSHYTHETVYLAVYSRRERAAYFALAAESNQAIRYVSETLLGKYGALHAGASGRSILSFLPKSEQDYVLERPLEGLTSTTLTDRTQLAMSLQTVRDNGYAKSAGERVSDAGGYAVPIFYGTGSQVFGSVIVTMPLTRFAYWDASEARRDDMLRALNACAKRIADVVTLVSAPIATSEL